MYILQIDQLNSDFSNLQIDNFTELLRKFGINTTTFNSMDELNLVIPKNTHILCTINADVTAKQLLNALPNGVRYGILEIIKGYNNSFCRFIYYTSTFGRIYTYDSRSDNTGVVTSFQEWREIAYLQANNQSGDVLSSFDPPWEVGGYITLIHAPYNKKYVKIAFMAGSTVASVPAIVGFAYPWLFNRNSGWTVGDGYCFAVFFGDKKNVYMLQGDKLTWLSGDIKVRYIVGYYS